MSQSKPYRWADFEEDNQGKYLHLAKFFLDQRGTQPYYFEQEEKEPQAVQFMVIPQIGKDPVHAIDNIISVQITVLRLSGTYNVYGSLETVCCVNTEK